LITVPRLALTAGEPAGIGPDLCIQLAQHVQSCQLIIIASPELLEDRAKQLNLPVKLIDYNPQMPKAVAEPGTLIVCSESLDTTVQAGILNSQNSKYVVNCLQRALNGCLAKEFDGVVTGPVHKGVINDAEIEFTGHTEFFADGANIDKVVMMLATDELRVALVTTHLPLSAVSAAITKQNVTQTLSIINSSFKQQFGKENPRIAVCGLNPHAGENGHMGTEEIEVISPVIEELKKNNPNISGPWPADTIFVKEKLADYDVIVAMYHDQGLPVLKHNGFGRAVNITLGLPFIRTSVDHGTALDLAGTGHADIGSLLTAIDMAVEMSGSQILA
jgi:4-hydroxythreonine-4-phosphate dehydrogenase